jgi:heme/copper-type cytochrome/quinol oxidase subunit 3
MAGHQDHAEHHHHATNTGIDNKKLAFWLFLASECMFFGSLIVGYLVYKGQSLTGPTPSDLFDIPLTTVSTFVLLGSSLFMVLAVASIGRGDMKGLKAWIAATAGGGLVFLGFQAYEFWHFATHWGLHLGGPDSSLFGSTFYTLTGFHGAHVAIGVLWLISILVAAMKGKITKENALDVEIAGLYWHFVDVVWIVIFTVIYLVEAV